MPLQVPDDDVQKEKEESDEELVPRKPVRNPFAEGPEMDDRIEVDES